MCLSRICLVMYSNCAQKTWINCSHNLKCKIIHFNCSSSFSKALYTLQSSLFCTRIHVNFNNYMKRECSALLRAWHLTSDNTTVWITLLTLLCVWLLPSIPCRYAIPNLMLPPLPQPPHIHTHAHSTHTHTHVHSTHTHTRTHARRNNTLHLRPRQK